VPYWGRGCATEAARAVVEGIERQHLFKAGRFEDLARYAILRSASTETTRESA